MIDALMSAMGLKQGDVPPVATARPRRTHERRSADTCVTRIDEQVYPVENWSPGGVLLSGDGKFLGINQIYSITLRFKLTDRVLDIVQPARVVRKAGNRTALQFTAVTPANQSAFRHVIDDWVAAQFAGSQV